MVSNKTIHNRKQIINKSKRLSKTTVNIDNTRYNIKNDNFVRILKPICGEIVIKKELLSPITKDQIGDYL